MIIDTGDNKGRCKGITITPSRNEFYNAIMKQQNINTDQTSIRAINHGLFIINTKKRAL